MNHLEKLVVAAIVGFSLTVISAAASDALESPIVIVAHRGANHQAPENTRAAAKGCIALDIDYSGHYVEIDVQQSLDGVFYILHDRTVNRTTNGIGFMALLNSEKVDTLDAGSWFSDAFQGEPVPRLKEYLEWIKGKAKVYLDVKAGNMKQLIDLIYEVGFEKECFFWFGDEGLLTEFRTIDSKLSLKINAHTPEEVLAAVQEYGASIVETQLASLTPEFVATCRSHDVAIMIYEREDTPETYRRILDSEADMINLDKPELLVEVLRAKQKEKQ